MLITSPTVKTYSTGARERGLVINEYHKQVKIFFFYQFHTINTGAAGTNTTKKDSYLSFRL